MDCIFFDIGNTLGKLDPATGVFRPFGDSAELLAGMRQKLNLQVGIITTLGVMSNVEAWAMLEQAGLTTHIDQRAFVSEHDAGVAKPNPRIFEFAAERVGHAPNRCLFVGESLLEVVGARAAGMRAILKPYSRSITTF